MKIAFIARVMPTVLSKWINFDRPVPDVKWGFPFGAELVRGLVGRGHEVSVVFDFGHESGISVFRGFRHENGGRCDVYLVPESRTTIKQFLSLFSLEVKGIREALHDIKPDVVFANWTYCYAYAALTSGYPTLVVAHDSPWRIAIVERNIQAVIKAVYSQLMVLPKVRHMTTVSPYIVDEFRKWNRYHGEINVIPNGIRLGGNETDVANQRTSFRERATTIVCVSDWSARKNVKTFFSAWSSRKKLHPSWRAVVFGGGLTWDGEAGKYIRRIGLSVDGLELRGQTSRSEIDRVLREEADLFVSPSLEESFGMVFVEAMRFGIPCIGGENSGAVPWVIGEGGVVCDVTDHKKLAECIEYVMGNVELRKKLSENGRKRVKEMFDIEKIVGMYELELKRVTNE